VFRFTDYVRGDEIVRDVKQKYPETTEVFEKFGLRPSCYDCAIKVAARKVGASVDDLLIEVNKAIQQKRTVST
jgi:iron-sulfur cluster repair protein YtfE (RIC family)